MVDVPLNQTKSNKNRTLGWYPTFYTFLIVAENYSHRKKPKPKQTNYKTVSKVNPVFSVCHA